MNGLNYIVVSEADAERELIRLEVENLSAVDEGLNDGGGINYVDATRRSIFRARQAAAVAHVS